MHLALSFSGRMGGRRERGMSLATPKELEQVLVIDDDEFIVKILIAFLEQLGYRALSATSGNEASRLFLEKKDQISLVILDQNLPDASGVELAGKMRSVRPNIPIVMSSGYDVEEMWREIENLGITAFISKPVTYDQLSRTVRSILGPAQEKKDL